MKLRSLFIGIAILFPLALRAEDPQAILRNWAQGNPAAQGSGLPETSFVPVEAQRLAQPRLLWVNLDLLREKGIPVPPEGLTADLEKKLLDALAWGIPGPSDPPQAFAPEKTTFYADRYGGGMIANHFGSGRAASIGGLQFKGIGRTPLLGELARKDHVNGAVPLEEAIREPIWGEVNHHELPFGGNRVLALIERGTSTTTPSGQKQRDTVIVREFPVRPAHFMKAWNGIGALTASDEARVKKAAQAVRDHLPGGRSVPVEAGLEEYATRVAKQYAAAFVQKFYHGATSASNIEIGGGFLDYGTQTAQPGYGKVKILDSMDPAGTVTGIRKALVEEFASELAKALPPEEASRIPPPAILGRFFDKAYERAMAEEFLKLTGAPPQVVSRILERKPDQMQFGKLLEQVATEGAETYVGRHVQKDKFTHYDVNRMLTELSKVDPLNENKVNAVLDKAIPGAKKAALRKRVLQAYQSFMGQVYSEAATDGVAGPALATYIRENARIRNVHTPEIYRWNMMDENFKAIESFEKGGDRAEIWRLIDRRIEDSRRIHKEDGPYEITVPGDRDPATGKRSSRIYSAVTGKYRSEMPGQCYLQLLKQIE